MPELSQALNLLQARPKEQMHLRAAVSTRFAPHVFVRSVAIVSLVSVFCKTSTLLRKKHTAASNCNADSSAGGN
jgi:hypothetical protein